MDDRQNAKLNMYTAVETVLDAHPDALAPIPAAVTAADAFRALLTDLRDASLKQEAYTTQGAAKQALRQALTEAAVPVAQAAAAWATVNADIALAGQLDFHPTDFLQGAQQDALERAEIVHDTAAAKAEDLLPYGVTPARLAALGAAIAAFNDALGDPRHAIAERKAQTERIETLIPQIDALLTGVLDRLVELLHGTTFYSEYRTARTIIG